jgi:hypothetical protein
MQMVPAVCTLRVQNTHQMCLYAYAMVVGMVVTHLTQASIYDRTPAKHTIAHNTTPKTIVSSSHYLMTSVTNDTL